MKELYHDPDRLRRPVRRTANGWEEISWEDAYQEVAAKLGAIREQYGHDAVGMYTGNPVVHDLGALLYRPVLQRALASRDVQLLGDRYAANIVQTGLMSAALFDAVPCPISSHAVQLIIEPIRGLARESHTSRTPGRFRRYWRAAARSWSSIHAERDGEDGDGIISSVPRRRCVPAAIVHTCSRKISRPGAPRHGTGLDDVRGVLPALHARSVATTRHAADSSVACARACYRRIGGVTGDGDVRARFRHTPSWGCDLSTFPGNLYRPGA